MYCILTHTWDSQYLVLKSRIFIFDALFFSPQK
uniref:Uncharacterized protein n=1 Tax=Lepeophtheirus salmonis TaxID=72036 RepID=A0A0K2UIF9_LEPSM